MIVSLRFHESQIISNQIFCVWQCVKFWFTFYKILLINSSFGRYGTWIVEVYHKRFLLRPIIPRSGNFFLWFLSLRFVNSWLTINMLCVNMFFYHLVNITTWVIWTKFGWIKMCLLLFIELIMTIPFLLINSWLIWHDSTNVISC